MQGLSADAARTFLPIDRHRDGDSNGPLCHTRHPLRALLSVDAQTTTKKPASVVAFGDLPPTRDQTHATHRPQTASAVQAWVASERLSGRPADRPNGASQKRAGGPPIPQPPAKQSSPSAGVLAAYGSDVRVTTSVPRRARGSLVDKDDGR
ncbi:hypothetical protein ColTof4_11458 [Colletotrichum tofieldiae]|nr:hypothetical protein ColTof3_04647 [Colletotrichum tofieldiae]GKT79035.1 hypothetical protein ColTof4_11458 [Colletotrichum tofieldiae]